MRDSQRSKVYAAERSVWDRSELMSLDQCQDYVDSITRSAWWKHRSRLTKVSVESGARGGRAWAHYGRITTSPESRTRWIMLHELGHILNDNSSRELASHGSEFCANYVALVRQFLGKEEGVALKQAFRGHRVKVRGAQKAKVRRVHCAKCGTQFSYGSGWALTHSSVSAVQFCTKRCGIEWFSARLSKA